MQGPYLCYRNTLLGPTSTAFQSLLIKSWFGSGVAGTWYWHYSDAVVPIGSLTHCTTMPIPQDYYRILAISFDQFFFSCSRVRITKSYLLKVSFLSSIKNALEMATFLKDY